MMNQTPIIYGVDFQMSPREGNYTLQPTYSASGATGILVAGVGWLTPRQRELLLSATSKMWPGAATETWCANLKNVIRNFLRDEEDRCAGIPMGTVELRSYQPTISSSANGVNLGTIRIDLTFDPVEKAVGINVWHYNLPDIVKTGVVKEAKKWVGQPQFTSEGIEAAQNRLEAIVRAFAMKGTIDPDLGIPEPDSTWWKKTKGVLGLNAPKKAANPFTLPEKIQQVVVYGMPKDETGESIVTVYGEKGVGKVKVIVKVPLTQQQLGVLSRWLNDEFVGTEMMTVMLDLIEKKTATYLSQRGFSKTKVLYTPERVRRALTDTSRAVVIAGENIPNMEERYSEEYERLCDLIGDDATERKVVELAEEVSQEIVDDPLLPPESAPVLLLGRIILFSKEQQREAREKRKRARKRVIREVERLSDLDYDAEDGDRVLVKSSGTIYEFSEEKNDWFSWGIEGPKETQKEEEDGEKKPKTRKFDWN